MPDVTRLSFCRADTRNRNETSVGPAVIKAIPFSPHSSLPPARLSLVLGVFLVFCQGLPQLGFLGLRPFAQ